MQKGCLFFNYVSSRTANGCRSAVAQHSHSQRIENNIKYNYALQIKLSKTSTSPRINAYVDHPVNRNKSFMYPKGFLRSKALKYNKSIQKVTS